MNSNRYLLKLGRISAWILLVLMVLFIISGYAWEERIIMPLQQARWIHTQLDTCLVFFFLVHALISAKFTLRRWKVGNEGLINASLLLIGAISFLLTLSIK
ncbi:MAG: hypothetical protein A4E48_01033 [Methanosaeta sp. PtaU1.Bin060]|nr:MAG: hypothetical protein A4E48_01033 [Methanosaeta sp. PtaU1.Bin060]